MSAARFVGSSAKSSASRATAASYRPGRGRYAGGSGLATMRPAMLAAVRLILVPLVSALPLSSSRRGPGFAVLEDDADAPKDADDPGLWAYLGVAVALVLLGGAFAGLTIALMGQDETYLQVIATSGDGSERRHAQKVLNLLKKGKHWVLVTLLLSNVITNETLPIVLDRSLGGGWPAVLSSTVLIVIFGEIAPQSVCVRYGLSIGAFCAPFVLALMWIMCPVAWPTAKLLDWLLGEDHGTTYKKAGLKTLVQLHKTLGTTPGERLMDDEVTIINSVLDLKDKPVGDIMTPIQDVFTMSADTVLDEKMMELILSQGYSRIPIYYPDNVKNFIGMLLVKMLITYDPEDCKRVRDFALATLPETNPVTSCLDIINFFQEGKSHMVLVSDFPGEDRGARGVVTLEDVIEELIGEEIIDESDVFVDVHKAIRRMAPAPRQQFTRHSGVFGPEDADGESNAEDAPLLGKENGAGSRKPSVSGGGGNTTVLMRRRSSTGSSGATPFAKGVPVRSNQQELRRHLSHLGPSNAASHPKMTRVKTISIKPGVGTIPEDRLTTPGMDSVTSRESEDTARPDGDENRGLLTSAGRDASDGVQAVQTGYGTIEGPSGGQRRLSQSQSTHEFKVDGDHKPAEGLSAQEASEFAKEHATPRASSPVETQNGGLNKLRIPKVVIGPDGTEVDENDEVGALPSPSPRYGQSPKPKARSGSITETTVNVGGMKKTVLEAGSSSSEEEQADDKSKKTMRGGSSVGSRENTSSETVDEPTPSEADGDAVGDGGKDDGGKKKRKKRNKKKKSNSSSS